MRVYLFDLDDTLIRTLETKSQAIRQTGKKYYGVDISEETIRGAWGKPFRELMREVFPDTCPLEEVIDRYVMERDAFPSPAYPEVHTVLGILSASATLGIITSHAKRYVSGDLLAAGISPDLFTFIQAAEDTQYHKPDPRVFDPVTVWLTKLGISKAETIYVGDSLVDYQAASGANIPFVAVYGRTVPKETFVSLGIPIIGSLRELPGMT